MTRSKPKLPNGEGEEFERLTGGDGDEFTVVCHPRKAPAPEIPGQASPAADVVCECVDTKRAQPTP